MLGCARGALHMMHLQYQVGIPQIYPRGRRLN